MSTTTCRAVIRIYRRRILTERLRLGRTDRHRAPLRPRSPQSLLVLKVSSARRNDTKQVREALTRLLVWDIMKAPWPTPTGRNGNPGAADGKSIVVYLVKPAS